MHLCQCTDIACIQDLACGSVCIQRVSSSTWHLSAQVHVTRCHLLDAVTWRDAPVTKIVFGRCETCAVPLCYYCVPTRVTVTMLGDLCHPRAQWHPSAMCCGKHAAALCTYSCAKQAWDSFHDPSPQRCPAAGCLNNRLDSPH